MSASVNLPLHHKVQKVFSGASSPWWSRKKGGKMVVMVFDEIPCKNDALLFFFHGLCRLRTSRIMILAAACLLSLTLMPLIHLHLNGYGVFINAFIFLLMR